MEHHAGPSHAMITDGSFYSTVYSTQLYLTACLHLLPIVTVRRGEIHILICGPIRDYHTVPSTTAAVHSFNWTDTYSASTPTRGPQPSGREGGTRLPRWRTCSVLLPQYRFHSESDARRCAMYAISCDQAEPIKAV